jgi:tRNA threonylcarbamoyl adenosine modification protein (Sua5/YciO/YrdC/YwlC family)
MAVEIQRVELDYPHRKQILHAAKILKRGGVIVYPTDTIYGLAADILNKDAIARIFRIKNVSKHKLLTFICLDLQSISEWAYIPNRAFRVMKRVLPGPYTFILPASKEVPKAILQKRKTVGVRIPDSQVSLSLVEELGRPLLSTSVPRGEQGEDFFTDPLEIADMFRHEIDLILDAGIMPNNPSTIVDFTEDPPEIVRKGAGDIDALF